MKKPKPPKEADLVRRARESMAEAREIVERAKERLRKARETVAKPHRSPWEVR